MSWFVILSFFILIMIRLSLFVENIGLEPMTPCVQGRCSKPTELIPRLFSFFIYATLACDVNEARILDLSRCKSGCSKPTELIPRLFSFFICATLACDVNGARTDDLSRCKSGCSKPTELIPRYSSLDFRFQRQDIRLILSWFLVLDSNIFLGSPRQSWTADLYIISVAL